MDLAYFAFNFIRFAWQRCFVFRYLLGCKHVCLPWDLLTKWLSTEINSSGEFSFTVTWNLKNNNKRKKKEEKEENKKDKKGIITIIIEKNVNLQKCFFNQTVFTNDRYEM